MSKQLIEHLVEKRGVLDKTWDELAIQFGIVSGNAARNRWFRYKGRHLKLVKQTTDKNDNITFQTYKKGTNETVTNKEGLSVTRVVENVYGGEWITWEKDKELKVDQANEFLSKLKIPILPKVKNVRKRATSEIANITDLHIGLSTRGTIYKDLKWNEEELKRRIKEFISRLPNKKCNITLNILGDFTDGLKGRTARGGHDLPQNMTDKEQFEFGITILLLLGNEILKATKGFLVINYIANSNHPGVMEYVVASAYKKIVDENQIEVNILEDFLNPMNINGRDFILSHGYDSTYMKRGWPRFLNADIKNRLLNFIKNQELTDPILIRGDQHQYHDIKYQGFRDMMVPAFSNPSGWATTNFLTDYKGGFTIMDIKDDGSVTNTLYNF